jgi:Uma2 family endonuclease
MATMILDPNLEQELIAQRAAWGGDRFDEVWEGVYMMSPLADNEHQDIQGSLTAAIKIAVGWNSPLKVRPGVNVSDREDQWEHNYRCPDVVAFAPNTKAKDCGTHWRGGPDFAIEITSPNDRSRDKFEFYANVGVEELLLVDRKKWTLELYRLADGHLQLDGISTVKDGKRLASGVLGLTFRLVAGKERPRIDVATADGQQSWLV